MRLVQAGIQWLKGSSVDQGTELLFDTMEAWFILYAHLWKFLFLLILGEQIQFSSLKPRSFCRPCLGCFRIVIVSNVDQFSPLVSLKRLLEINQP
jgi:hypothetical protein